MDDDLQEGSQIVKALPEFSVQNLLKQFEVSKPTLYGYFEALGIKTVRMGRAAYISEADYDTVRQLIVVLQQRKNTTIEEAVRQLREKGFDIPKTAKELEANAELQVQKVLKKGVNSSGVTLSQETIPITTSALESFLSPSNSPTVRTVIRIGRSILNPLSRGLNSIARSVDEGVVAFVRANPPDPLKQHKILKEAAELEFALPSSKLAEILELKKLPSSRSFERIGYRFTKIGKSSRETLWGVTKLSYKIDSVQEQ